jgi:hypothetical protein
MTTVTGLTAARMLEIEGASVIDGDIDGDNLILTRHDGTQINAGDVRGPVGPVGPVGHDLSVLSAVPVLDLGLPNQIRAGRQLTAADFTNMGLSAPLGLWNLSDLTDASGNGRALLNKGAVPFVSGINGLATTAARFSGSTAQALYIADAGGADVFRLKVGSGGCWMKTAKRSTQQHLMAKYSSAAGNFGWLLDCNTNVPILTVSINGTALFSATGVTDICDDRWHFISFTVDGTIAKLYVDGVLEGMVLVPGLLFSANTPFNIGGRAADGATNATNPFFGRIDEAFVSADVLSEEQMRNLYCAKITHALAALPTRVSLAVRRGRKGAAYVTGDFPAQPIRLHNFSAAALTDIGSGGVSLTNSGTAVSVPGVDGTAGNGFSFAGAQALLATDTGLPAGTTARSYGCWFKIPTVAVYGIMVWGTGPNNMTRLNTAGDGTLAANNGTDSILGPFVCDGLWHHAVVVEDNAAVDGVKRKLYLDGHLVAGSTVLNSITLVGANGFKIGQLDGGANPLVGQIDGVFATSSVLTAEDVIKLFAKSLVVLPGSPKNTGDHVEVLDTAYLLCTFDTLDVTAVVDLVVA